MSSKPSTDVSGAQETVVPLIAEEISVSKRGVEGETVTVASVTREREVIVEEALNKERIEVKRVPIGRTVQAAPPTRQEGDVTIMSVVEEVLVVERRLVLKEEVHVRRIRTAEHYRETLKVRDQDVVISRTQPR